MITVHIIYMIILESFLPGSEPPIFTKLYDFCILDMQLCLLSNSMKQVVLWLLSLWSSGCEFKQRFNPCGLVITQHNDICVQCEATSWFLRLSSILSKQDNDVFNVCGFKKQSQVVLYRYTCMYDVSSPLSVLLPSPSLFSKPSARGSSCMSLVLFNFFLLKRSFSLVELGIQSPCANLCCRVEKLVLHSVLGWGHLCLTFILDLAAAEM